MKEKRINLIADYIQITGIISMEELCQHFNISMSTLRRDINILLDKNQVEKVYGGVAAIQQKVIPFENRYAIHKSEKSRIAQAAAKFIYSNELIFIDSGTTTQDILKYLNTKVTHLTVLTNNLDVINYIANQRPDIGLITVGNFFKHSTRSFAGDDTMAIIEKYNISKAFMAATAISIENGLTNSDPQEFGIKKKVVEKSQHVYVLADKSKFGGSALLTYAKLTDANTLISSKNPPDEYINFLEKNNIQLICV